METRARRVAALVYWGFAGAAAIEVVLAWLTVTLGLSGCLSGCGRAAWGRRIQWAFGHLAVAGLLLPPVALVTGAILTRALLGGGRAVSAAGGLLFAVVLTWVARQIGDYRSVVSAWNVGSAKRLRGNCTVFHFFLGDDWSEEQKEEALRCARTAWDWLVAEASAQGVPLHLNPGAPQQYRLRDRSADPAQLTSPDPYAPYAREQDRLAQVVDAVYPEVAREARAALALLPVPPDHVALLAHVPGAPGYAMPVKNTLGSRVGFEICVCGRESSPATYAHELLHLFGAPDLYLHPWFVLTGSHGEQTIEARLEQEVVARGFPSFNSGFAGSVMANGRVPLNELRVDPITAASIGWPVNRRELRRALRKRERLLAELLVSAILAVGPE